MVSGQSSLSVVILMGALIQVIAIQVAGRGAFSGGSADSDQGNAPGDWQPGPRRRLTASCLGFGLVGTVVIVVIVLGLWRTLAKPATRTERQSVVNGHRAVPDGPEQWNNAAWQVVRSRRETPERYAEALRQAEAAVQAAPDNGYIINTLGVAQYRLGRYADALATLTKSEKLNAKKDGSHPADLAFLAMTRHQLGQKDEAKTALAQLREVLKDPRWLRDGESRAFLREADELIEGEAAEK